MLFESTQNTDLMKLEYNCELDEGGQLPSQIIQNYFSDN